MSKRRSAALAPLGLALTLSSARAEDEVVRPFNGTDLGGWKFRGNKAASKWVVGRATPDSRDLHENVKVKGPTTACLTGKESPAGPLMLQGDHGPVAFRNIIFKPHTPE
jgi:hypothetical protein